MKKIADTDTYLEKQINLFHFLLNKSMPYLEQKLEDHCRIDVLFCDRGQPQVRPLDVEERGPSDVSHRRPNLEWIFSSTAGRRGL